MYNRTIRNHWKSKELLGYNCILSGNGNIIMLDFYAVADGSKKSYFISPICDTTIESIEKYNDDPWTEIEIHSKQLKLGNGDTVYCGEGGMGNEGFVALEDNNGNLKWAFFSTHSNPFVNIELIDDNTIRAYSTYDIYFNINILSPENIKVASVQ